MTWIGSPEHTAGVAALKAIRDSLDSTPPSWWERNDGQRAFRIFHGRHTGRFCAIFPDGSLTEFHDTEEQAALAAATRLVR